MMVNQIVKVSGGFFTPAGRDIVLGDISRTCAIALRKESGLRPDQIDNDLEDLF